MGTGNGQNDAAVDDAAARDKIRPWLELIRSGDDGPLKAGDWMRALIPFLDVQAASASGPHPSATFTYTVQADHCNRLRTLHGGAAATLFDFCTTMPLVLVGRPGYWQHHGVSRSLNVTYLRPARAGEAVVIEAHVVQVGKKLATLKGVMRRRHDGQLLCTAEHLKVNIDPEPSL